MIRTFLSITLLIACFTTPTRALESCAAHPLSGTWTNIRQELKTLSSLEVEDLCDDSGPYGRFKTRAKEVCHPRACSWGWTGAFAKGATLVIEFKTFTAIRKVEIAPFADRARAVVTTNYISDGKPDKKTAHILVRQRKQN